MNKNQIFYEQVLRWINSYRDADPLQWLRRFVENSTQPFEVKRALNREIDRKVAALNNAPWFSVWEDDVVYLMDKHGGPALYTTRYRAIEKLAQLRRYGYDVRLMKGDAFYRIQLIQPAPIDVHQPLDVLTAQSLVA